ncbi:hypothetical protein [Cochleicola gelatinilyticus]|uniref:Uncharacterized protein n=1 Tax=Cochleicola gelatinilyticus TaxID=1763537 RepID=A0A167HMX3_9FLAO|nr:hypothetical protein [Cochleicola gelatinilyticus]OAB78783.1 hypothetical protein ULVI_09380 [Cochleicola gelatinilyticus]
MAFSKAKNFLDKMYEVMQGNENSLLSERQIFLITNNELPEEQRISMSYYEFLKSESQNNKRSIKNSPQFTEEEREHYLHILELGRAKQIQNLTKGATDDVKKNAYPYLEVLKMKCPKFRNSGNNIQIGNGNTTIQITASNDNHKNLIDNLINGEIMDVDYDELEPEKIGITKRDEDMG